jgi:SpoVK/Ycf46/Vps4 family AAA+-type ATPase
MNLQQELDVCLRSRVPLIYVLSHEEERAERELVALCQKQKRDLYAWDHADGCQQLVGQGGPTPKANDPLTALDNIDKISGKAVVLLRDFHQCWKNQPRVVRKLRNLAHRLKYSRKSIVITAPVRDLPDELHDETVVLDFPPPDMAGLRSILDHLLQTPNIKVDLNDEDRERLLRAALGLSSNQAQRVFAKAIVTEGVLDERDIDLIHREMKQIVSQSEALEFFLPRETVNDVGGLDVLKQWLRLRERAFCSEAREYGLPAPKGIALIGIPGTGKSLTAKMVANLWHLPLLRLDVGALFGGLVGQSEENCRKALQLTETVAPCVLWIDEMEKALSTGEGDGGTSLRVFGTILSWMQEKQEPVFVVATANDISRLPPELLRRGRFDEIFFLDLPTALERREIFQVHIGRTSRQVENFELDLLVAASQGHVGAEIEQALIDAMYAAFNDPSAPAREFTTSDIEEALHKLVPMSRSQRERIRALRQWLLEGRAQSASFVETAEAQDGFVPIELEPIPVLQDG